MKNTFILSLMLLSLSTFAQNEVKKACSLQLQIDEKGNIQGATNSQDISDQFKSFKVFDDDGLLTQMAVFNKALREAKDKSKIIFTAKDRSLLKQALGRSIAYKDVIAQKAKNGEYGDIDPEVLAGELAKQDELRKYYRELEAELDKSKDKAVFNQAAFKKWGAFIESQRDLHTYDLFSATKFSEHSSTVDVCQKHPGRARCCADESPIHNNILAMGLCGINFETLATVNNVHPEEKSSCDGYAIDLNNNDSYQKLNKEVSSKASGQ